VEGPFDIFHLMIGGIRRIAATWTRCLKSLAHATEFENGLLPSAREPIIAQGDDW